MWFPDGTESEVPLPDGDRKNDEAGNSAAHARWERSGIKRGRSCRRRRRRQVNMLNMSITILLWIMEQQIKPNNTLNIHIFNSIKLQTNLARACNLCQRFFAIACAVWGNCFYGCLSFIFRRVSASAKFH